MISPLLAALLALVVVATSFLSGIFGMAGGLILLGILLAVLDVAPAMVLFGTTQLASNGWRGTLWRAHVRWDLVWRYGLGSVAAFVVMRYLALVPGKAMIYIGLGLMPFVVELLPGQLVPDISRPFAPFVCGALIIVVQLLAGAAGSILDIFFQKLVLLKNLLCPKDPENCEFCPRDMIGVAPPLSDLKPAVRQPRAQCHL